MIRLQRASAGSGKTYTLAITYLQFFLGVKQSNGVYRLRTERELRRSHSHILAVTFTRRATNEMKDRIVGRLAQMAYAPQEDPDFLRQFAEPFDIAWPEGTMPSDDVVRRIANTARHGLQEMLGNYSDMKVSTIDSFFQSVLRAFTYEADMPDDYGVELDDNLVIEQALDKVLRQARINGGDEDARYWLRRYMNMNVEAGRRWNVMRKGDTAYREILDFLKMISHEQFKATRLKLSEFFSSNTAFRNNAQKVEKWLAGSLAAKHKAVCQAAKELTGFINVHLDGGRKLVNSYLLKRLEEIPAGAPDRVLTGKLRYESSLTKTGEKRLKQIGTEDDFIALISRFYDLQDEWAGEVKYAAVIRDKLHVLGLLRPLLEQIATYLQDNNMVQLSDTNSFLSRIINSSDAPFIYEKIGYYLRHYLIDEFQDTSRMQWNNLKPLLDESLSTGIEGMDHDAAGENDSLIIGDAKQSIYRFRNADPDLISQGVEQTFGAKVNLKGTTPQENTNYRSAGCVVDFNNSLFSTLCAADPAIEDVYANVRQRAAKASRPGYVQVTLSDMTNLPSADNTDDEKPDNDLQLIPYLGPMIGELLRRGYCQNEIAILVRTNALGKATINTLMEYNASLPPGDAHISFISADSLEIGRSRAVKIVVAMLKAIIGTGPQEYPAKKNDRYPYIPTAKAFNNFLDSVRGSDSLKDPADSVEEYFLAGEETHAQPDLGTMATELHTSALPAIVEAIISRYVKPRSLLTDEAPFLAAFQDMVLDYCERFPADVASFLHYYELKGKYRTIASPQDADAVNVLTIHSAKGLQFRVVICPEMKISTVPGREKLWVHPDPDGTHREICGLLPELLPIAASAKRLEGTPWQPEMDRLNREALLDAINIAYVAFTRAEDELYVVLANGYDSRTKKCGPPAHSVGRMIWDIINSGEMFADDDLWHPVIGSRPGWSYGVQADHMTIASLRTQQKQIPTLHLQGYIPDTSQCRVEFVTDDNTASGIPGDSDGTDLLPAFSEEAARCRRVLLSLTTAPRLQEDLIRAILSEKVSGTASTEILTALRNKIERWIHAEEVRPLFAEGLRVLNRRCLLNAGPDLRGAGRYVDRLVTDSRGNATAITFYPETEPADIHRTVASRQLDALRRCGLYTSVTAFIWYPSVSRLIPVS